jgi:hypothetical protein
LHQRAGQRQQAAAGEGGGHARSAQFGEDLLRQFAVVRQGAGEQTECDGDWRDQPEQQQFGGGRQDRAYGLGVAAGAVSTAPGALGAASGGSSDTRFITIGSTGTSPCGP